MKILIVEDETAAYENLVDILREIDSTIQVVGNTESISQTINWLSANQVPDLILMDIHLSDGSALRIFDNLSIETPIVFTTAFDEYALDAFRVNSIDYLLKPIKKEKLSRAIEKFKRLTRQDILRYISQLSLLSTPQRFKDTLLIPIKDALHPLRINDIAFFYATEKHTYIHLFNGQVLPFSKPLEQIEKDLNPSEFIRANKQFILSRKVVTNITIWFDSRLLIKTKVEPPERIYISKNKAANFKAWMMNEL